ncbi:MAG TPA: hypothetical protein VKR27_06640 [Acidimicrobiales bacterium]|nr:hypothetical protein [Acidimicrobiales bacterium]
MTNARFFPYQVARRLLPLCLLFGLRRSRDGVTITENCLIATYGFFQIVTDLANIKEAHVTRNYRWWTAFGVRASFVDDGLSFGTNRDAGVCIHFRTKVPSILRRKGHSALTVTVTDVAELSTILSSSSAT